VFLTFEFQDDRSINVGAVGGQNFPFPIDKAHRLYNSLLLPHKPWWWKILNLKSAACARHVIWEGLCGEYLNQALKTI